MKDIISKKVKADCISAGDLLKIIREQQKEGYTDTLIYISSYVNAWGQSRGFSICSYKEKVK